MSAPMEVRLEHVTPRANKDGTTRYYFRRRGQPTIRLPGTPGTVEFSEAYQRQLNWVAPEIYASEGSFAWLCDQYLDSYEFKSKAAATRAARKRIIVSMLKEKINPQYPELFGEERATRITPKHIRVLRDRKSANAHAANERLKILSQIFKMACVREWVEVNPVKLVEKLSTPDGGHVPATDEQIAQYFAYHTDGTAWLAMKMLTEWGMRVSDLRVIGRQHVKGNTLVFDTIKTKMRCELPISAEMMAILPHHASQLAFLITDHGKQFASAKAMSQRVSSWFRQAGIEGITGHGVRKWLATRKAENGATEMQLMAWFGWRDSKEAKPYIETANRRKLASQIAGGDVTQGYGS